MECEPYIGGDRVYTSAKHLAGARPKSGDSWLFSLASKNSAPVKKIAYFACPFFNSKRIINEKLTNG